MNFLPYEDLVYKTKLKEDEVIERLQELTLPKEKLRFKISGVNLKKRYVGEINKTHFIIKRIINYQNSFLPRISGTITQTGSDTIINVKIRIEFYVKVFTLISVGFLVFLCAIFIYVQVESLAKLIPFFMILFGYFFSMATFNYETNKSKKDLEQLFEGEIVE